MVKDTVEARKYLETRKEGEYEYKKYHIIEIKDFDNNLFNDVIDGTYILDDGEDAYYAGIPQTIDGDIAYIDVNKFLSYLEDRISSYKEENDEDNEHFVEMMQKLFNYLDKFNDYDIWFTSD